MPPDMRTPPEGRRVAESFECAEHIETTPRESQKQERLWQAFQLAVEVDLAERTDTSYTLRSVAWLVWRDAFMEAST